MEGNVVLKSKDRELFGITIKQETKTGFLSVSELQKAYDVARWQYGWSDRKVADIMQTKEFKERVFYLLENQSNNGTKTRIDFRNHRSSIRISCNDSRNGINGHAP